MAGLRNGTACVRTRGRHAGEKVVVVDFDGKSGFAVVEGRDGKKKRCNIMHLFPAKTEEASGEK